jgi:hypothetical protein
MASGRVPMTVSTLTILFFLWKVDQTLLSIFPIRIPCHSIKESLLSPVPRSKDGRKDIAKAFLHVRPIILCFEKPAPLLAFPQGFLLVLADVSQTVDQGLNVTIGA